LAWVPTTPPLRRPYLHSWYTAPRDTPDHAPPLLVMGLPGSGIKHFADLMLNSIFGAERWQHTAPIVVNRETVGFSSGVHAEIDVSAISTVEDWNECVQVVSQLSLFAEQRQRRTVVLYRVHAASFLPEILGAIRGWPCWVVLLSHRSGQYREKGMETLLLPSPTPDEVRAHWVWVLSTNIEPAWAAMLQAYWERETPPSDWVALYERSYQVLGVGPSPSPSPSSSSLSSMLTWARTKAIPRYGVSSTMAELQRQWFDLRCEGQVAMWSLWDHKWAQLMATAAGQRSWMLQLYLFVAMTQHEAPFTRVYV